MRRVVLAGFIILAAALFFGIAKASVHIERRGVVYFNGFREPPITCENNSRFNASVYYRGKMYFCPNYSETEIVN
jgi:hypothetical protein